MRYCGVVVGPEFQHLCALEEVRPDEPPVRLRAIFFEPGSVGEVVAGVPALGDVVVAVASPQSEAPEAARMRACDAELLRRGVTPQPYLEAGVALYEGLADLGIYAPAVASEDPAGVPLETAPPRHGPPAGGGILEPPGGEGLDDQRGVAAEGRTGIDGADDEGVEADDPALEEALSGPVEEGAFRTAATFEVNVDGVFCALQGRRVPAKRHPLGLVRRIDELLDDHVEDEGGELWHRRIEEIEAAAAALAAHRYAVGHACWLGDPDEGVIVLPGTRLPAVFSPEGVIPPVPRAPLPAV